ncbi:MAG: hypothetical protein LZF60_380048 [Nitrospira sp.]|nr:hypothetical protein [Nitrospira sp.]ULA61836.1 MAG: hypothetical protein LZF60_380048 [Nitrospira sp.]
MTVHRKDPRERIEALLAQAHRTRGEVAAGEDWAQEVMRTIRREAAEHPVPSLFVGAEPLVWRAAACAALVALVFAGSVAVYTKQHAVPVAAVWLEEFDAGSPFPER